MKHTLIVVSLLVSPLAFASHPGGMGGPMGGGVAAGVGHSPMGPAAAGMSHDTMPSQGEFHEARSAQTQAPLRDSQLNGGAFRMLEQKTGLNSDELRSMYSSSGARNFGEFTSAVVVSKNLGLDTHAVLDGLRTESLGETLKNLGVAPDKARQEIKHAKQEIKAAD